MITMQDVLKHLQVHIPFDQLFQKHLGKVLRERINPEIAFNSAILERFTDSEYAVLAKKLCGPDRSVTFHGPFMDLRPGAVDPEIRKVSLRRFSRLFEIAVHFRPRSIVFHPSYDEKYYASSGRRWLENSIETWSQLLPLAERLGTRIALENVYEPDPDWIERLLEGAPPGSAGFLLRPRANFNAHCRLPHRPVTDVVPSDRGQSPRQPGRPDEHRRGRGDRFPLKALRLHPGEGASPIRPWGHTEQNLSKARKHKNRGYLGGCGATRADRRSGPPPRGGTDCCAYLFQAHAVHDPPVFGMTVSVSRHAPGAGVPDNLQTG